MDVASTARACSRTSSLGELSSWTKIGTAPLAMTTPVCSDVPDATLVSAHAASNCASRCSRERRKVNLLHGTSYGRSGRRVPQCRRVEPHEMYLQLREVRPLKKLHEAGNDALADDLLNRWVSLCKQRQ